MALPINSKDYSAQIAQINGQSSNAPASKVAEMQDRFLKILVTQLQNQDPMNPMENAELTSQLAQMSTVEGIAKLNSSMDSLVKGYQASQTVQAAALIGKTVLVDGDTIDLRNRMGGAGMELQGSADKVLVKILDDYGNEVRRLDLGARAAGRVDFAWDGVNNDGQSVPDGSYWYAVEAARGTDFVDVKPLALTGVTSVLLKDGGIELQTATLGPRSFDQVRQIF